MNNSSQGKPAHTVVPASPLNLSNQLDATLMRERNASERIISCDQVHVAHLWLTGRDTLRRTLTFAFSHTALIGRVNLICHEELTARNIMTTGLPFDDFRTLDRNFAWPG